MKQDGISLREQAEVIKLLGMNQRGTLENMRRSGTQPELAAMIELRLPVIRAAHKTLDTLAKDEANG